MSGQRPRARRLALAAAVAAPALYARWLRPWLLTWGATPDETSRAYPGDELIPDADHSTTMATTLPAPPERLWPWLVQMGGGRGGWYGWDWLDNHGAPSADRIEPQWQHLQQGQRLDSMPSGRNWMTVAVLEPNRTLVLRSNYQWPSGRTVEMGSGPLPRAYTDAIWSFHLRPVAGGRTRLVARTCARGRPRPVTWLVDVMWEPVHFSMQIRQFYNLRTRVGAEGDAGRGGGCPDDREGDQGGQWLGLEAGHAAEVQQAPSGHHATTTAQHGHRPQGCEVGGAFRRAGGGVL